MVCLTADIYISNSTLGFGYASQCLGRNEAPTVLEEPKKQPYLKLFMTNHVKDRATSPEMLSFPVTCLVSDKLKGSGFVCMCTVYIPTCALPQFQRSSTSLLIYRSLHPISQRGVSTSMSLCWVRIIV